MVARLGGDEFAVVMEGMPAAKTAARLAAQALKEIRQPFASADHGTALAVTASIGIAFFAGGRVTAGQLVAEADAMLYAAKESGRDRSCIGAWPQSSTSRATAPAGMPRN
jgi:diguanylate cyclase (GGDEF)-like protein